MTLCGIGMSIAIVAGYALPPTSRSDFLSQNTCAFPCLYGITLGETPRDESLRILSGMSDDVLEASGAPIVFTTYIAQQRVIDGAFWFSESETGEAYVSQLYANDGTRIGDLADLLLMGYRPYKVYRTCTGFRDRRLLIMFDDAGLFVAGAQIEDRVTPHTPITLLYNSTVEPMLPLARLAYFGGCAIETEWQGFSEAHRYFSSTS
jgi:hypothetical protein